MRKVTNLMMIRLVVSLLDYQVCGHLKTEVAEKMGIKSAAFWPAGPANLAFALHIPKLIEEGIIDIKGKI